MLSAVLTVDDHARQTSKFCDLKFRFVHNINASSFHYVLICYFNLQTYDKSDQAH